MTLYLQMDGIDDKIVTPSLTYTEVIIDSTKKSTGSGALQYLVDGRQGSTSYAYLYSSGDSGPESFSGVTTVYKNGTQVTSGSEIMALDERVTVRLVTSPQTSQVYFFSRFSSTQFSKSFVYNIKLYNAGVLVAHYDMTTGTVQDQSGNGNHATLTGGTWLDDGVSGGMVVDAGTLTLSGDSALTPIGSLVLNGTISLSEDDSLTPIANIILNGESGLSDETELTVVGNTLLNGNSTLSSDGLVTVEGITFDSTKLIYSKTKLDGKRELTLNVTVNRELTTKLNASSKLTIRLVGDTK